MSVNGNDKITDLTADQLSEHIHDLFDLRDKSIDDRLEAERQARLAWQDGKDLRDEQRFDGQQAALKTARDADQELVKQALLTTKEAVQKAETAADKRFDALSDTIDRGVINMRTALISVGTLFVAIATFVIFTLH
jgi:hypothetical protein